MEEMQPNDRRHENRYVSVLRVCCIETSQGIDFALLRNISANGAQIEADVPDPIGSPISYFFDDSFRVEAEIAWKKDGRVGLANRAFSGSNARTFPRRALRVPLSEPAKVWIEGVGHDIRVANISQSGALLMGVGAFRVGLPITLEIGHLALHNVTVRWASGQSAGVQFERPVHVRDLRRLVEDRRLRIHAASAPGDPANSGSPGGPDLPRLRTA